MTKQKPPPHHWSHRPKTRAGQTTHLDDVFKKSATPECVAVAGPGQKPKAELSPGAATPCAKPKPGRTTKQPLAAMKQPDPENPGPARASHACSELPPPAIRRIHSTRSCRSTTKTPPGRAPPSRGDRGAAHRHTRSALGRAHRRPEPRQPAPQRARRAAPDRAPSPAEPSSITAWSSGAAPPPLSRTATEGSRRRRAARALPSDASGGGERRGRRRGTCSSPHGRPGAARRGRTGAGQEKGKGRTRTPPRGEGRRRRRRASGWMERGRREGPGSVLGWA
ncbi:hypothetical protein ACQJBY_047947 [Aegilops geniculata]